MQYIARRVIILFCLFHMAAVGTFAVPTQAKDPFARLIRYAFGPLFTPYMLATSQWQRWNLFAPDPLRRISTYRVEVLISDHWQELARLEPGTYPWWRHAARFKMLERMLEPYDGLYRPAVVTHFLQSFCRSAGLPPATHLRLIAMTSFVPTGLAISPGESWQIAMPAYIPKIGLDTACPGPKT